MCLLDYTDDMFNEYCKEVIYNKHPGRTQSFSVQKVYDLQALCTKIRVYQRVISVAIKVKLLNRFQFHQLQLKTNKTRAREEATHSIVCSLIMPPSVVTVLKIW